MTAIYISLSYIFLELFNWKKLNIYNSVSTSFLGLVLILTVAFDSINFYNLQLISIEKLFALIPLYLLLLITNIFESKFDKNYIYIKRMVLYSNMVIIANIELIYVVFGTFCILYEIYNRSVKANFAIKTNFVFIIPFLLTLPLLNKIDLISNYYEYYIISFIILVTIFEFDKMNVFRALSLMMLSCLLLNLNGNAVPSIITSLLLLFISLVQYLYEHSIIQKKQIKNRYLDRFLHKGYIFFEKKEELVLIKQDLKNNYKAQDTKDRTINHHNDVVTSFIYIVIVISVLGLYVIFRN